MDLFVYGTLLFDDVVEVVAGRVFPSEPARLPDYACRRVRGQVYPGLRRQPGALTEGRLLLGVDDEALARIDYYEGDFYTRHLVEVVLEDGRTRDAVLYLPGAVLPLADTPWHPDRFARLHLAAYLAGLRGHPRPAAPGTRG